MKQPIRRKVWAWTTHYISWGSAINERRERNFSRNPYKYILDSIAVRSCPLEAALFGVGYDEI